MKRKIEIFTAGCPVCDSTVKMVKELVCDQCEIKIYDLVKLCDDKACIAKVKEYGIESIPAVAINGRLLDCCKGNSVSRDILIRAGVGQG